MEVLDFTTGQDLTLHEVKPKPWMQEKKFVLVTKDAEGGYPRLKEAIEACMAVPEYALDLETTGLDLRVFNGETKAKIVGACLSPDGETGYYIPLRHQKDGQPSPYNVPMSVFRKWFTKLMEHPNKAIFHNGKFDQEFLQWNGVATFREWDDHALWEDTLILAYLRDSRAKQKGLKFLSKQELNMDMIELHELYGHDTKRKNFKYDFSMLDPSKPSTLWYAGSDAICTYLLKQKLAPQVLGGQHPQTTIYAIEKACVAATRWMERCRVHVDRPKVAELINIGQKELYLSLCSVYDVVSKELGRDITPYYFLYLKEIVQSTNPELSIDGGMSSLQNLLQQCRDEEKTLTPERKFPSLYGKKDRPPVTKGAYTYPAVYDVMSPQQLGPMLLELNVPDLPRTEKSNQVQTSAEVLDAVLEKHGNDFPWIKHVQRYREVQKALSTYLIPLWEDSDPYDSTIKINFNAHKTDTGRFSAPASEDPSRDGGTRFPAHGVPSTYDPNRPECMTRLRECVSARPGKVIAAIDFSGEELRIITNLSGEQKWLAEFFRCSGCGNTFPQGEEGITPPAPPPFCPKCGSDKIGDIHTLTALNIYGPEAPQRDDWKKLRGNAKSLNFAMAYGGSGKAATRATGCSDNEGHRLKMAFDAAYLTLSSWWKRQHDFGRTWGYVLTPFGRKCPVPDIQLPQNWGTGKNGRKTDLNGGFRSKAERNATNAPVQGGGADTIKIAMARVYQACKKRGWLQSGKVLLIATVHDELVFEIDLDILEEALEVLAQEMTSNPLVLNRKWRVPLTVDIECGPDWTVHWNITRMIHGKDPWVPELQPYFKKAHANHAAPGVALPQVAEEVEEPVRVAFVDDGDMAADSTASTSEEVSVEIPVVSLDTESPNQGTEVSVAEPRVTPAVPSAQGTNQGVPSAKMENGTFSYTLKTLKVTTLIEVAQLLRDCVGKGSARLRLFSPTGQEIVLPGYGEIRVQPQQFIVLAEHRGL